MSNQNESKSKFFGKIKFDEKTRCLRDNGMAEAIASEMSEAFSEEELKRHSEVSAKFNSLAADVFKVGTQEMQAAFTANEELGSLTIEVETNFGNLEMAMNRPDSGFTKDNIASATGLGIKQKLDTDTFQSIYDDLESVFDD